MAGSRLARIGGGIGMICAITPIPCDAISWILADSYNPISQSISNLAVGASSWLIDAGLWFFAAGCVAVAAGLWSLRIEARYWTAALVALMLTGVAVAVIARVNDYAGQVNPGINLHIWAVVGVGLFFLLTAWLSVPGLRHVSRGLASFSLGVGAVWIVLAPLYWFVAPDDWSGAVERLLALVMLAWLARASHFLRRDPGRL